MGKLQSLLQRAGLVGGGVGLPTTFMPSMKEFITPYQFASDSLKVWGDCRNLYNTSITAGSNVVTNTVDQPFANTDVGASIWLINAGPNSSRLQALVTERVSASQVKINAVASATQTNGRCVIAHDDSTAVSLMLASLAPAAGRSGKAAFLGNGHFMVGPQRLPNWSTIYAAGRSQGGLYLKPGSAAGADKFLLRNTGLKDARQAYSNMLLCGLRDFQMINGVLPTDIELLEFVGGSENTAVVDVRNLYENLSLTESCRSLLRYRGKGGTTIKGIEASGGTYGLDFDAYDCNLSDIHIQGYATSIKLGSAVGSCRFDGVKAYYAGYVASGQFGAGEHACWDLNGCFGNNFVACEGQESHGSVMVMSNVKRCTFDGFRLADPGCVVLHPGHGLNPADFPAAPSVRAGVQILNGCQNNVLNFSIGARVHGTTNYGTHAVAIDGANTTGNSGRITTDLDLTYYAGGGSGGWGVGKIGKNVSGEGAPGANPALFVDAVAI